eukprot:scaffold32935_cov20-Tisochrysis_lutea.AAC.3
MRVRASAYEDDTVCGHGEALRAQLKRSNPWFFLGWVLPVLRVGSWGSCAPRHLSMPGFLHSSVSHYVEPDNLEWRPCLSLSDQLMVLAAEMDSLLLALNIRAYGMGIRNWPTLFLGHPISKCDHTDTEKQLMKEAKVVRTKLNTVQSRPGALSIMACTCQYHWRLLHQLLSVPPTTVKASSPRQRSSSL